MNAALSTFLSAKATGALSAYPVDDVFDMISDATEDTHGLAASLGLPPEEADVDPGTVARPLVDSYLRTLSKDDGGAFRLAEESVARGYREQRYAVSRTLGIPESDFDAACDAADAGSPAEFDRMMSRYFGA